MNNITPLDDFIETIDTVRLTPGVEVSFFRSGETKEKDLEVYIFWHTPSLNLGWYPIAQIFLGNRTILHVEGSEDPLYYYKIKKDISEKLNNLE